MVARRHAQADADRPLLGVVSRPRRGCRACGGASAKADYPTAGRLAFGRERVRAPRHHGRAADGYRAAGGNFIDTANNYQSGESERLLGEFIANDRDEVSVDAADAPADELRSARGGGSPRPVGGPRRRRHRPADASIRGSRRAPGARRSCRGAPA
ncbi:aldo/keto reductase [Sorangium sp. So ce321]|uniref:aldo/keto reductase n=1 Tax=Sorangium sp. So ce321 TaxID=3133300 RepID=UPI003F5F2847